MIGAREEHRLPDGRRLLLYGPHGAAAAAPRRLAPPPPASEIRFNELRGEEVVYAAHRQERTVLPAAADCPLCPTRAGGPLTEVPVEAFEVAVFENRFPSLAPPAGACEVVVYTDRHDGSFASLPAARAEQLVHVWRDRYEELGARAEVDYVLIFENRGEQVGVTLHHPHGQVYAFPFLPPVPAAERAADGRGGGCAVCAALRRERADAARLVYENPSFAAYVPHAARWPYEVHVTATAHRASLLAASPDELRELAAALQAVTRGYDALFGHPLPYVLALHQAPTDGGGDGHLHAELTTPVRTADRIKHLAGCEQAAGTMLMDALPERTAPQLRAAIARAG